MTDDEPLYAWSASQRPPSGPGGSQRLFEHLLTATPASGLAHLGRQLRATAESMARAGPPENALETAEVAVLIGRHLMPTDTRRTRADLAAALETLAAILRRCDRLVDAERCELDAAAVRQGRPLAAGYQLVAGEDMSYATSASEPTIADLVAMIVPLGMDLVASDGAEVRQLADRIAVMAKDVTTSTALAEAIAAMAQVYAFVKEVSGDDAARSAQVAAKALRRAHRSRPGPDDDPRLAGFQQLTGRWLSVGTIMAAKILEDAQRIDEARKVLRLVAKTLKGWPGNRDDATRLEVELAALRKSQRGRGARALDRAKQFAAGTTAGRGATRADPLALARSAFNLALARVEAGQVEQAWTAISDAVRILRELVAGSRAEYLPDLAIALQNAAGIAARLGRDDETIRCQREVCDLYRELTRSWASYGVQLAIACSRLLVRADAFERSELVALAREAIHHFDLVVDDAATVREHGVVQYCQLLASVLSDSGERELTQKGWRLYYRALAVAPA
ncbi:hypothetical protein ACFCV3_11620 [Kribbella sp. NPDC056345]|uniref:hypothetical protein n=1 Tax=Kribbella sp. NPDC056345 TaxID=3345789 RepID=UPI0035E21AC7